MKKEGYAGAGEMRSFVEYLWGWDATVTETVDDGMWKETFDTYVEDKHNLGMKNFFEKSSPYAYQDMTARMVETIRKGYWNADSTTQTKLLTEYVESVNKHGVSCSELTCGNARLSQFVMDAGRAAGIPVPALEGFQKAVERATGGSISQGARAAEQFAAKNEARSQAARDSQQTQAQPQQAPSPDGKPSTGFQGYVMQMTERTTEALKNAPKSMELSARSPLWIGLPILGLLLLWRQRRAPLL